MANPKRALDTMAREELGLNPEELGSSWGAAISSFIAFALGAIVPVIPYLLPVPGLAFVLSALFSGLALVLVGGALAFFTGLPVWFGSLRMLTVGVLATAVTYGVGRLVGVSIS